MTKQLNKDHSVNADNKTYELLELIHDSMLNGCPGYSKEKKQCRCAQTLSTCGKAKAYHLIKEILTEKKTSVPQEKVETAVSIAISSLLIPCEHYVILQDRCTCPESKKQECHFLKAVNLIHETINEIIVRSERTKNNDQM